MNSCFQVIDDIIECVQLVIVDIFLIYKLSKSTIKIYTTKGNKWLMYSKSWSDEEIIGGKH